MSINPFLLPRLHFESPENIQNPNVLWHFQGAEKGTLKRYVCKYEQYVDPNRELRQIRSTIEGSAKSLLSSIIQTWFLKSKMAELTVWFVHQKQICLKIFQEGMDVYELYRGAINLT